jgi:hypothetical protein
MVTALWRTVVGCQSFLARRVVVPKANHAAPAETLDAIAEMVAASIRSSYFGRFAATGVLPVAGD